MNLLKNLSTENQLEELKKKLRDQEILFDNILEGTLAGYWDWYIQDDYEYMSPGFKSMFGYEDHEIPNHPTAWQEIIHPDDLPYVFEVFDKHVSSKGKIPYDNQVRYFHKDGSIVWVYCRGKVIEWDETGQPIRMVGCHVDITKLKKAEDTEKYAIQLEKKNKELKEFAYVASHDLQEPLRTINSFVDILKEEYEDKLDQDANTYLRYISEGAKRMSALVKDLLDYNRLGANSEHKDVDLNTIMEQVRADLNATVKKQEAELIVNSLPTVSGQETELRLLFQNLISNALKFSKKEVKPRIKVSCKEDGSQYLFSVEDNGIGIEEEFKERIFVIFQRLHSASAYEGTGIGLALCRKIVDSHGGEIKVTSVPGQGSNFLFTLPR